ncbi:MAG: hypothetical protein AAF270_04605 [Pseudomonadota bacterium]
MRTLATVVGTIVLSACATPMAPEYPLATLKPAQPQLQAREIVQRAYAAAGGESWRRPTSLSMRGYAVFYREGVASEHEQHNMWRVYDWDKRDAHQADGKVRIESKKGGVGIIDLAFDGRNTFTPAGRQPASKADEQWASSFGFGVIRHALDPGYHLSRLPDDLVDGSPAYVVNVTDPAGGITRFAIAQSNNAIVRVGFDTARGWHERVYSNFFSNPGVEWRQPGRVRLYYDGVKANEVIWTEFSLNDTLPDCLFQLPEPANCER